MKVKRRKTLMIEQMMNLQGSSSFSFPKAFKSPLKCAKDDQSKPLKLSMCDPFSIPHSLHFIALAYKCHDIATSQSLKVATLGSEDQ